MDWEGLYQTQDTGWDRGDVSTGLQQWLVLKKLSVERDKRVLIPGCGRGYEVVELAKLGFDVTGLDIAPTAIADLHALLKNNDVQAEAVCGDLFTYQTAQPFDVVYEQTCLCALPLEKRGAYEEKLFEWLKPDGRLLLSMMQTGENSGPPFHCDWSDMCDLFSEKRWVWQKDAPFIVPHWRDSPRFELGFVLHKKA